MCFYLFVFWYFSFHVLRPITNGVYHRLVSYPHPQWIFIYTVLIPGQNKTSTTQVPKNTALIFIYVSVFVKYQHKRKYNCVLYSLDNTLSRNISSKLESKVSVRMPVSLTNTSNRDGSEHIQTESTGLRSQSCPVTTTLPFPVVGHGQALLISRLWRRRTQGRR